ncbi:MAG: hypothetical protein H0U95_07300 [Bacteroidetes bacterium]|nr:hypothetical protein [Bacteroidota bacterium]
MKVFPQIIAWLMSVNFQNSSNQNLENNNLKINQMKTKDYTSTIVVDKAVRQEISTPVS